MLCGLSGFLKITDGFQSVWVVFAGISLSTSSFSPYLPLTLTPLRLLWYG